MWGGVALRPLGEGREAAEVQRVVEEGVDPQHGGEAGLVAGVGAVEPGLTPQALTQITS